MPRQHRANSTTGEALTEAHTSAYTRVQALVMMSASLPSRSGSPNEATPATRKQRGGAESRRTADELRWNQAYHLLARGA